jgi:hypothetical protein
MAPKPVKNTDPYVQLLFTGHTPKGVWSRKAHAGVGFCVSLPARKGYLMLGWFKKMMLLASVYSLSATVIYFAVLPSNAYEDERRIALQQALSLGIALTILVIYIWNKVSKKFDL